jgi:ribosomal protein L44E
MGNQKKRAEELNLKLVDLVFECPNGHKVIQRVEVVHGVGNNRILDAIRFRLQCSECNWKDEVLGSRRIGVELVEASKRTR